MTKKEEQLVDEICKHLFQLGLKILNCSDDLQKIHFEFDMLKHDNSNKE